MIISILGMAGIDRKTEKVISSKYSVDKKLSSLVKKGSYINSTDALLKNNINENFILIGTEQSIKKQKEILNLSQYQKNIVFKTYNTVDLGNVFNLVYKTIQSINDKEKIYFDITHSFRDTVIMSIISTIVHQFVHNKDISIIFAKESSDKQKSDFEYIDVTEYIDISQMAFMLTSFHHTLNLPKLSTRIDLYTKMQDFSKHLFSNQINLINKHSYKELKDALILAKENSLSSLDNLIEEVLKEIEIFETIKEKEEYEMFFELSKLMCSKNYLLISSTYLVEALAHYAYFYFKKFGITNQDFSYDTAFDIINYIQKNITNNTVNIPHKYFYCSNKDIFERFSRLVKMVKEIRNRVAHIDLTLNDPKIKFKLIRRILEFKKLVVEENIFENITTNKLKDTENCKYDTKLFQEYVNEKFKQIFNTNAFNNIFEKSRIDKLASGNYPITWNIDPNFTPKQQQFIGIISNYTEHYDIEYIEIFYNQFN